MSCHCQVCSKGIVATLTCVLRSADTVCCLTCVLQPAWTCVQDAQGSAVAGSDVKTRIDLGTVAPSAGVSVPVSHQTTPASDGFNQEPGGTELRKVRTWICICTEI